MMYKYYVVYLEFKDEEPFKISHGEITLKNKIKCEKDIMDITNILIKHGEGIDYAMLLNYILMEEIGYEDEKNEETREVASESL